MRPFLAVALLALAGCEEGPNLETRIDDVQVVAAVAEPLVVEAGAPRNLTVYLADPLERGAEILVWSCDELDCRTARAVPEDGVASLDWVSPADERPWILGCAPDTCDLDDPRLADLRDPFAWMAELPLEGVSLSTRELRVSEDPAAEVPLNPEILDAPDGPIEAEVRDRRVLRFTAPGATLAWGYTTEGGFSRPSETVAGDGSVELIWFTPKKPADADLYVVFEDDIGGTAVWRGSATVR